MNRIFGKMISTECFHLDAIYAMPQTFRTLFADGAVRLVLRI